MFGLSRLHTVVLVLASLLVPAAGCTCGTGPYEGEYFEGDRPELLKDVKFAESEKGEPKIAGCADGQRELFADFKKFPRIAGCVGKWDGVKSLRDQSTGKACGDDGEKCGAPADLCAEGWHVCGVDGKASDLSDRVSTQDCNNAGPGRFNAALSHSPTNEIDPCPTIKPDTILPCVQADLGSEAVCCGKDCKQGKCKDGVWKGKTRISQGTSEGCGAVTSERNGGVLCCASGDANPAGEAVPAEVKGTDDGEAAKTEAGEAKAEAGEAKKDDAAADTAKADAGKKDEAKDAGKKDEAKDAGKKDEAKDAGKKDAAKKDDASAAKKPAAEPPAQ